jgi:pimeloyl-ACP methyl ester carboxylesterase
MSDASSPLDNSTAPPLAGTDAARRPVLRWGARLAGAALAWRAGRRLVQRALPPPAALPPAIDAAARTLALPTGSVGYYARPGTGTPLVLVHSFNAAASSREMQPLFDHLAATTDRPVYALDWLGFGRSDRADRAYTVDLYRDQLMRFLVEVAGARPDAPADVVALSLGGEVAAGVALGQAPLVRRLVLVAPTGLGATSGPSDVGRFFVTQAHRLGLFEALFYAATPRLVLRRFYGAQVFLDPAAVPDALVEYAYRTVHTRGAHRAAFAFVSGQLFTPDAARRLYGRLYRPTLLLVPETPEDTVQGFERADALAAEHPRDLTLRRLPGGLMPHWETPAPCFDAVTSFLDAG